MPQVSFLLVPSLQQEKINEVISLNLYYFQFCIHELILCRDSVRTLREGLSIFYIEILEINVSKENSSKCISGNFKDS